MPLLKCSRGFLWLLMSLAAFPALGEESPVQELRGRLLHVWRGEYECPQGATGIDVSLDEVADNFVVRGSFSFHNLPGMSNARSGAYLLIGRFDPGTKRLQMEPFGWIRQPAGYVMIGFTVSPSPDWSALEGLIDKEAGCSTIALRR